MDEYQFYNEFYNDLEKELHNYLLGIDTDKGVSLDDIVDIDDLAEDIVSIFKSKVKQYAKYRY